MKSGFEIGQIVRCINIDDSYGITLGKEYKVIGITESFRVDYIWIINNNGEEEEYFDRRFCNIKYKRNSIINDILE